MSLIEDATGRAPHLPTAIRTLLAAGFSVLRAERAPGYALIVTQRTDEFGATHVHSFQVAEGALGPAQLEAARIASNHHGSQLVIVGSAAGEPHALSWERFINLFGGPVSATSVFDPSFADNLLILSRNERRWMCPTFSSETGTANRARSPLHFCESP